MNANSIPEFVDVGNGNIKIVLSNFTGELIAKDIIGLTRYTGCPLPNKTTESIKSTRSPPLNQGSDGSTSKVNKGGKERNESSRQHLSVQEEIDRPDPEDSNNSVNLLEESSGEDTADDESTIDELAKTAEQEEGLNVSVAYDDDIEYEPELSQQVSYWKY